MTVTSSVEQTRQAVSATDYGPSPSSDHVDVPDPLADAVETLKFLSDRTRLRILTRLRQAETCVCDLIEELGLAQPLVSYHLGKLRRAGLIHARRDAQWVYYSLDPDAWERLVAPVKNLLQTGPLPPAAAWGAARRCDDVPPDSV